MNRMETSTSNLNSEHAVVETIPDNACKSFLQLHQADNPCRPRTSLGHHAKMPDKAHILAGKSCG
jgi:hypothetical protein